MFIKRFAILVAAVAVAASLSAPSAEAAFVLSNTFCSATTNPSGESTTCPTGLGATLTVETVDTAVNGVNDINDYYVTLTLDSTAVDRGQYFYTSDVQFSLQGAKTGNATSAYGDYEAVPTLLSGPDGTATWTVYFDTISGSVNSCTTDGNGTSTCAAATSPYTDTGDVDSWKFYVDFDDPLGKYVITSSTDTNLRATFLKKNGSIGGILSPDWMNITGGTGGGTPPDTAVPEPGSLLLLGSGLVLLGRRARKRMRRA